MKKEGGKELSNASWKLKRQVERFNIAERRKGKDIRNRFFLCERVAENWFVVRYADGRSNFFATANKSRQKRTERS